MNRRSFMRSLGAGIAAALIPFVRPFKPEVKGLQWQSNSIGIREQLLNCSRLTENPHTPLNLNELMDELYKLKRRRVEAGTDNKIEFWVTSDHAPMVKRMLEDYINVQST